MISTLWGKWNADSSLQRAIESRVAEGLRIRVLLFAVSILGIAPLCLAESESGAGPQIEFYIPQQRADVALTQFAEQADLTLIFPYDLTRKVTTNRLVGSYTIAVAVERLLAGTRLKPKFNDQGVLTAIVEATVEPEGDRMNVNQKSRAGLVGFLAAMFSSPVNAQDVGATQEESAVLDEIVVVAQRREQSMQEVPVSMSAFSNEDLARLNIRSLEGVAEQVPSAELYSPRGAGQPVWVIRGIGLIDFNSNNTPTAPIFYDDYYLTSNIMGGIGLFDVERVEVLKGPQGGLYGRNTTGGAILVLSQKPELEQSGGYAKARSGSYGRWGLEGALNAPLSDAFAFRLAGLVDQGGGWQDSLATLEDDNWGDRDFWSLRGQLLFDAGGDIDALLKVEAGEDQSETALSSSIATIDPITGGTCPALLQGQRDVNCANWYNLTNVVTGNPEGLGILPSEQQSDGSLVMGDPIPRLDNDWFGANLRINYGFDFGVLTSITGYYEYNNHQIFDFDGAPGAFAHEDGQAEIESWSQEFRLTSNSDGPLSWIVGSVYAEDTIDEYRTMDLSDNLLLVSSTGSLGERSFTQKTEAWSVYVQSQYDISDAVNVHATLRYTDETRKMLDNTFYIADFDFFLVNGVNREQKLEDNISGEIGLDWQASDDVLAYAKITKGVKSGGFYGGFAFVEEELDPYAEESVVAYEVGFKSDMAQDTLRLNGAFFFYDYGDLVSYRAVYNPLTDSFFSYLTNLADVETQGFELDANWMPPRIEGLSFSASLAYIEGEVADSNDVGLTFENEPFPLEGTGLDIPKWSYQLQTRYDREIAGRFNSAFQLDWSWRDDLCDRSEYVKTDNLTNYGIWCSSREGYGLLNARASIGSADGRWDIAIFGRNLTDEAYIINTTNDGVNGYLEQYGMPLTWGVEVGLSF